MDRRISTFGRLVLFSAIVGSAIMYSLVTVTEPIAATVHAQEQTDPIEKLRRQAEEAGQRAAAATMNPNEIEMIGYRRRLMGSEGLQMYVILFSRSGQPIDYFVAEGKCASSKKRLTPTHRLVDTGPNSLLLKAPSEDGTHGSSAPYIYCKTVDGKYKQWNGEYYASDSPIELTIKPLVIDTSGSIQSQQ